MSMESLLVYAFMSSNGFIIETGDQNIYSGCKTMHENNILCVIIVRKNVASLTQYQQQEEEYDPSAAGVVASTIDLNNTNNKTENRGNPSSVGQNDVP